MGLRGPKPGFKREQADGIAAAALAPVLAAPSPFFAPPKQLKLTGPQLTAWQRQNPKMLSGDALKDLGYRNGMARSQMDSMSDEKIRLSLSFITNSRRAE